MKHHRIAFHRRGATASVLPQNHQAESILSWFRRFAVYAPYPTHDSPESHEPGPPRIPPLNLQNSCGISRTDGCFLFRIDSAWVAAAPPHLAWPVRGTAIAHTPGDLVRETSMMAADGRRLEEPTDFIPGGHAPDRMARPRTKGDAHYARPESEPDASSPRPGGFRAIPDPSRGGYPAAGAE